MKEQFLTWLNRFLVFDVFLVIFAFFWWAIALVGHSFGIPLGLDLWYFLWQPLFNPALGILFLGAIASWLISKVQQRFNG